MSVSFGVPSKLASTRLTLPSEPVPQKLWHGWRSRKPMKKVCPPWCWMTQALQQLQIFGFTPVTALPLPGAMTYQSTQIASNTCRWRATTTSFQHLMPSSQVSWYAPRGSCCRVALEFIFNPRRKCWSRQIARLDAAITMSVTHLFVLVSFCQHEKVAEFMRTSTLQKQRV